MKLGPFVLFIFSFYCFLFIFGFSFLLFLPLSGQSPPKKIAPGWGQGLGQLQGQGQDWGEIFLGGNCLTTAFTGGKKGDFSHANEMLGFIHLLYVQSCTFLQILNELNGVSQMMSIYLKPKVQYRVTQLKIFLHFIALLLEV